MTMNALDNDAACHIAACHADTNGRANDRGFLEAELAAIWVGMAARFRQTCRPKRRARVLGIWALSNAARVGMAPAARGVTPAPLGKSPVSLDMSNDCAGKAA